MDSLIRSEVDLGDVDHCLPVLIEKSNSVFRTELEGVARRTPDEDAVSHLKRSEDYCPRQWKYHPEALHRSSGLLLS